MKDTDISSWLDLLNEFSDEGVVDCNIHQHECDKPGLVGDSTGLMGIETLDFSH